MNIVAEYSKTEAALIELNARHANAVIDVSTPQGMKLAQEARKEIKKYRTELEKKRKEIKAPALKYCQDIDSEARRITAELLKLEKPYEDKITAEENRIAIEKAEAARLEQQRVDGIRNVIGSFANWANSLAMKPSEVIENEILNLSGYQILDEQFMEFAEEARSVKADSLRTANEILTVVKQREADAAIAEQNRIELEAAQKRIAELEAASQVVVVGSVPMVIDTSSERFEEYKADLLSEPTFSIEQDYPVGIEQDLPEIDGQATSPAIFDPTDHMIVKALAQHFDQPMSIIVDWLNRRIASQIYFME